MMEENTKEITLDFLDSFLPPWDKIKDFTVKKESSQSLNLNEQENNCKYNYPPQVNKVSVKVTYENPKKKPLNLLIKTLLESSAVQLRKLKVFHKEIFFYEKILQEFKRIQNNCDNIDKSLLKLNVPQMLAASVSDVTDDPFETFIATSDITFTRGFQPVNLSYGEGLDLTHCKLVIKEVAKFHALSWVYRKSKAVLSLQVMYPVIQEHFVSQENKQNLEAFISTNVMLMKLQELQRIFGENCHELQIIEKVVENGIDVTDLLIHFVSHKGFNVREIDAILAPLQLLSEDKVSAEEEKEWAVGSHGDLRWENMMFRYDPKNPSEPLEVSFLNFSSYRECCPTIDLAYFLFTSADLNTRENHCQDLLQCYFDSFEHFCCTLLKKDAYPGFSINSLTRRFNRAKIFGLLTAISVLQHRKQFNSVDFNENIEECSTDAKTKKVLEKSSEKSESSFTSDLDKAISQQRIS